MTSPVTQPAAAQMQPALPAQTGVPRQRSLGPSRAILLTTGLMIAVTLATVGWVRLTAVPASTFPASPIVASRDLSFTDSDGGVRVVDAASGQLVKLIAPQTGEFIRSTLRGLNRERKRFGTGAGQPFRLLRLADGGLVLFDPATQISIDLGAFGPTNAGSFAGLLGALGNASGAPLKSATSLPRSTT